MYESEACTYKEKFFPYTQFGSEAFETARSVASTKHHRSDLLFTKGVVATLLLSDKDVKATSNNETNEDTEVDTEQHQPTMNDQDFGKLIILPTDVASTPVRYSIK